MTGITQNILQVRRRIEAACLKCGRGPGEVKLLLATKTVEAAKIAEALAAGETLIGENKVQELAAKYQHLKNYPHSTHFIGHLQSNKIREVVKYANCIQSVDSLALAQKLQNHLEREGKSMDIYIQVNTSAEESKFGLPPERTLSAVKEIARLDALNIKGLMTIGLFSAEEAKVRTCFKLLKSIQGEIEALGIARVSVSELSMGMSNDLETAVEEGATIIRVGTAVFGRRAYPDSYYWNENKAAL